MSENTFIPNLIKERSKTKSSSEIPASWQDCVLLDADKHLGNYALDKRALLFSNDRKEVTNTRLDLIVVYAELRNEIFRLRTILEDNGINWEEENENR